MLYGKASSYYGLLPAASNVRMSVFAVVQYTILLLSPYPFLRHFKPRNSL